MFIISFISVFVLCCYLALFPFPRVSREQRSAPGSLRSVSSVGSGVSSVIAVESNAASTAATTAMNVKSRPNSSLAPSSLPSNVHEDFNANGVDVSCVHSSLLQARYSLA